MKKVLISMYSPHVAHGEYDVRYKNEEPPLVGKAHSLQTQELWARMLKSSQLEKYLNLKGGVIK